MNEKKSILLIEDDPLLRESTVDFLEEEGFAVFEAKDGLEGIHKALNHIPDIILCDIAMPKFDGYQVYNTLQENSATALIPFIFLTAKTTKEDLRIGMQLGADDYITKPFDYDELLTTLNTRLEKREKILKASQEKYEPLLENSFLGVYIVNDRFKWLYFNNKLPKMFDYTNEEFQGISFLDLFCTDEKENLSERIRKVVKGIQNQFTGCFYGIDRKGKRKRYNLYGARSNVNGHPAIIGYLLDDCQIPENSAELEKMNFQDNELEKAVEELINNIDRIPEQLTRRLKQTFQPASSENRFDPQLLNELTKREKEILSNICEGLTNQEIADKLNISPRTVDGHRASIMSKTYTRNTAELVMFAVRHQLVEI